MDIVNINVGGTIFSTRFSTLRSLPNTRLSSLCTSSEEYIKEKDSFFFDRNPELFQSVLDLYRHGNLHVPSNICVATLKREMEFWQIPFDRMPSCCLAIICKHEDAISAMKLLQTSIAEDKAKKDCGSSQSMVCKLKRTVWSFLTDRDSSKAAKVFNAFYYILATLSVIIFVLESHPTFRTARDISHLLNEQANHYITSNTTGREAPYANAAYEILKSSNPKFKMFLRSHLIQPLKGIDQFCLIFFFLEHCLELITCQSVIKFYKSFINVLDCFIVAGQLIAFALEQEERVIVSSTAMFWVYTVCKCTIIFRVVRLFRLTRDIGGLRVLMLAVRSTTKQLLLLCITVLITIVFFSAIIYHVEIYREDSAFSSIPLTIWWSIITVTTVGYGDVTPTTAQGYVIASFCAVCGILLLAMPIAIVASTFSELSFINRVRERESEIRNLQTDNSSKKGSSPILNTNKIHVKSDKLG